MKISQALSEANNRIKSCSSSSSLDSELILAHVLNKSRAFLYAWPDFVLSDEQYQAFLKLADLRAQGQPIAYLIGYREFWSLQLQVNPSVLIPRPETELLVETTLKRVTTDNAIIADLGTGSGAIALALAKERPTWKIIATDYSSPALETAKLNAAKLNINNVEFRLGKWCEALPELKFDAIISNPPYIEDSDPHLQQGDLRFEPPSALIAGEHGLADIESIAAQAQDYLKPGGYLLLEHGYNQAQAVAKVLENYGYHTIQTYQDLTGHDRVSLGRLRF